MGNRQAANEGSDSRHRRCNKHSIFPAFCQGWRSNGRSASSPGWSVVAQPARIHNGQFRVDLPPVSNGQGPFFRQFPGRQVERLSEAHGIGKDRATAVQLSEPAVQALYGIGRIHDLPSGLGDLEHRADAVPVVRPVPSKALRNWVKKGLRRYYSTQSLGIRQRPILPGRFQPSTFSAERLNFCVRYGYRWFPLAIATGNSILFSFFIVP